jgi:hypothetical protein
MKLRFSPFPTKGIHSLNFFLVIDKFDLNLSSWWTIVSQDAFLIMWNGRFKNFKPKASITWFITSHLDVYNSMEHAHPSERCTHSTYICGSHIESSSNQIFFMQILCQWLVSSPIAQSQQTSKAIQPPSILWRMGKWKQTQVLLISIAL